MMAEYTDDDAVRQAVGPPSTPKTPSRGTLQAVLLVVLTLLSVACEQGRGPDGPTGSSVNAEIALPRILAEPRSVQPEEYEVRVFIDGDMQEPQRAGDAWLFKIPGLPARVMTITVEWRYRLPGATVVVARSPELRLDTTSASREVRVTEYDLESFDDDGDGASNFAEIVAGTDPVTRNATARAFTIAVEMPRLLVDQYLPDEVQPRFQVDEVSVSLVQEGSRWVASFVIEDDASHRARVTWRIDEQDTVLPLLQSANIQFDRFSSNEQFEISAYGGSGFDADGDGVSNLNELNNGTDPIGANGLADLTPGAGQGDCRLYLPDGVPASESDNPRERFQFRGTLADEEDAVTQLPGQRAYLATLDVRETGRLSIEHTGGEPLATRAQIYDVGPNSGATRTLGVSDDSEAGRARVVVELESGIYCLVMQPDFASGNSALAFSDTRMRFGFVPQRGTERSMPLNP